MARKINVGLIGFGFMGKAHSNAYRQVARFFDMKAEPRMKVICGLGVKDVKHAAEQYGWDEYTTEWPEVIARSDIDMIDICVPGNLHHPIGVAAAKAGKAVLCEKPLANTLSEAREMQRAAAKAGVPNGVSHNYRRAPAVSLAKRIIDEGKLGTIYHFRGTYLQDWIVDPKFPLVWRLDRKITGSGALGDLGAHVIDLARFLVGEIESISATMETFIKERPTLAETTGGLSAKAGRKNAKVTVDDAIIALARFKNGALGTIEATRFAPGRRNYNRFEINGSKGSLAFNLERMNELEVYFEDQPADARGFRTVQVTEGVHPYVGAWWPAGHIIGYEHTFVHTIYDFVTSLASGKPFSPSFADGVACQAILDTVEKAAASKKWEKVPKV
jgi:predicted dehydrogenase